MADRVAKTRMGKLDLHRPSFCDSCWSLCRLVSTTLEEVIDGIWIVMDVRLSA
jgi:hypothetical protein